MPVPRMQFADANGSPYAGGCLSFFNSGTSVAAPIFADVLGVIQLSNPVILDAAGRATIYLQNQEYRVTLVSQGGVNCATGSQIWSQDGVSAFQAVIGTQSITFAGITSDPAGVAGSVTYRSDIPCLRLFTTAWDCIATLNAVQTFTNKTINNLILTGTTTGLVATSPVLNAPTINGQTIGAVSTTNNNPTNFTSYTNDTVSGTTLNTLTKLKALGGGSTSIIAATSDTGGIEGVTIAGAGTSGSSMIQKSGQVLCAFDASTTVLDYVQISTTTAGDCHDVGSTYPSGSGQVLGRVLTTNVGAGTYLMDLFGPEIRGGGSASIVCTNFTPVTVSGNNAQQNLQSCIIPANSLAQGSLLHVTVVGIESTAAGQGIQIGMSLGGGTACLNTSATAGIANNQPWTYTADFIVLTAGAGGTANISCGWSSSASGGGVLGANGVVGAPTIAINTTIVNTLQITEQMSVNNAGNTVVGQLLKGVIF